MINPHEAITEMTFEERQDFMWRARHAECERQERDTEGGATRWLPNGDTEWGT
jgi:hypothetical protein